MVKSLKSGRASLLQESSLVSKLHLLMYAFLYPWNYISYKEQKIIDIQSQHSGPTSSKTASHVTKCLFKPSHHPRCVAQAIRNSQDQPGALDGHINISNFNTKVS